MQESTRFRGACGLMVLVLVGQSIGMVRYGQRLPGDRFGLALYVVTIVAAASAVSMLFRRWRGSIRRG